MNPDLDWDGEQAKEPLHITLEIHGRTAALIRLISTVTDLTVDEVATRRIEAGAYAAKNITNFISHLFKDILGPNPPANKVEHAVVQLRLLRDAGHLHGFDDIDLDLAISEQTGQVDVEIESLLKAAAKIIEGASE